MSSRLGVSFLCVVYRWKFEFNWISRRETGNTELANKLCNALFRKFSIYGHASTNQSVNFNLSVLPTSTKIVIYYFCISRPAWVLSTFSPWSSDSLFYTTLEKKYTWIWDNRVHPSLSNRNIQYIQIPYILPARPSASANRSVSLPALSTFSYRPARHLKRTRPRKRNWACSARQSPSLICLILNTSSLVLPRGFTSFSSSISPILLSDSSGSFV